MAGVLFYWTVTDFVMPNWWTMTIYSNISSLFCFLFSFITSMLIRIGGSTNVRHRRLRLFFTWNNVRTRIYTLRAWPQHRNVISSSRMKYKKETEYQCIYGIPWPFQCVLLSISFHFGAFYVSFSISSIRLVRRTIFFFLRSSFLIVVIK